MKYNIRGKNGKIRGKVEALEDSDIITGLADLVHIFFFLITLLNLSFSFIVTRSSVVFLLYSTVLLIIILLLGAVTLVLIYSK